MVGCLSCVDVDAGGGGRFDGGRTDAGIVIGVDAGPCSRILCGPGESCCPSTGICYASACLACCMPTP